ncbi:tubulin polyglutamylase TTLL5-like isoform X2 [Ruditapes philippinarum]|nr:tubulin polyglutamylase TTLL5-like isoform X2 [Ruditapes philippinarum]
MAGLLDRLETEQLRARKHLERKHTHLRRAESVDALDEDKFDRFVHTASEGELEEVLTTYTKINKSASIFLGGKATGETTSHVPTTGNSMQHIGASSPVMRTDSQVQLNRRKDSDTSERSTTQTKTVTGWEEVPKAIHSVPTSSNDLRPHSSHTGSHSNVGYGTRPASYNTNSAASYANAVQIYTQKLSSLRPRSATTAHKTEKQVRSRPSSAVMARSGSAANSAYGSTADLQGDITSSDECSSPKRPSILFSKYFARNFTDPYNDKVITEALQRLTMRQQARQYSAYNGTSLVPSDSASRPSSACGNRDHPDSRTPVNVHDTNSLQHINSSSSAPQVDKGSGDINSKYIYMEEHVTKNRPPSGTLPKRSPSAIDMKSFEAHRRKQSNVNLQSANATFNSFIEDTGPNWQNDLALAYNQVTGVTPQNYHTPTQSSKQYQIMQQQALKQQSKVLLEQSKAKHQAMIAQAHAVQKSLLKLDRPESEATMVQMYAPKPPVRPGTRKAASAHHRMPRRAVPEETSLNFQFCSTDKSNVNGGW